MLNLYVTEFVLIEFSGGNCWLNVNKNGRCTSLVKAGSSKEDCCNRYRSCGFFICRTRQLFICCN